MTLIEKIAHAIFVTTHAPTSWDSELFSIEQATAMYQARAAIKAMLANEDMIETAPPQEE